MSDRWFNLEVLSWGFDPQTKMNWPLEWTVRYSQGRVSRGEIPLPAPVVRT